MSELRTNYIAAEVPAGTPISNAFRMALDMSRRSGAPVKFKFNGTEFHADYEDMVRREFAAEAERNDWIKRDNGGEA